MQRISVGKKMDTNDLLDGEIMVSQRWVTENRKVSKSILEMSAVLNTTQQMPAVTQANTHATKHTHEAQDTLIRLMTMVCVLDFMAKSADLAMKSNTHTKPLSQSSTQTYQIDDQTRMHVSD